MTETKWGVTFVQCGALTKYHGGFLPMSRLMLFTDGSDKLEISMYIHENRGEHRIGWYEDTAEEVKLRRKFNAPAPDPRPARHVGLAYRFLTRSGLGRSSAFLLPQLGRCLVGALVEPVTPA